MTTYLFSGFRYGAAKQASASKSFWWHRILPVRLAQRKNWATNIFHA
jgi:hypothetical protein